MQSIELKAVMNSPLPTLQEESLDALLINTVATCRDEGALNILYLRHRSFIRCVVSRVLRDESETEEVVQDVFHHLWKEGARYDPEKSPLLAWLAVLSRRRAIDRLRQRCRYQRACQRFEIDEKNRSSEVLPRLNPGEKVCSTDLQDYLELLLRKLPCNQRQVLLLTYYEGMSQRNIAARLNLPLGTVRTRIELGLRKLSLAVARVRRETS